MRSVLISIKPKWCELIASGKKTVEVRKTKPKLELPFKCYIYCTKQGRPLVWGSPAPTYVDDNLVQTYGYSREEADRIWGNLQGKVIGEFVCRGFEEYAPYLSGICCHGEDSLRHTEMSVEQMKKYLCGKTGYGWNISELVIYEDPKTLANFGLQKAPQSWCYVKEVA